MGNPYQIDPGLRIKQDKDPDPGAHPRDQMDVGLRIPQ
jgi:hypothetical protein